MNEHDRRRLADLERHAEQTRVRATPSSPIVARAVTVAGQVIANVTTTIVNYGDVFYDLGGGITIGAAWKYTAPISGYYAVTASVAFVATATWSTGEIALLTLFKSGVINTYLDARDMYGGATPMNMRLGGTTVVLLLAGEYMDIRVYQASGAALALAASALHNHVSIWRI